MGRLGVPRRLALGVLLAGTAAGGVWLGIDRVTAASALTVSYSSRLQSHESLIVDSYETVSALGVFRSIAARLTAGKTNDHEKLEALADWTNETVRPQYAAPSRIVADNVYDIVRRGFGYCDQDAHVFATLARLAGYDSRLLFLRRADGVSPHSVAQVDVGGRWVVVDAWLGVVWADEAGVLLTVEDVLARPSLYKRWPYERLWSLHLDDFARGTAFRTFPYQSLMEFIDKVATKVRGQPFAPPPSSVGLAPLMPAGSGGDDIVNPIDPAGILTYDRARRLHLEGRYRDAVAAYQEALRNGVDADISAAARFFIGLALLRAGDLDAAIAAFARVLETDAGDWRPSVLQYQGTALEQLGDRARAITAYREAATPGSLLRLEELGAD